MASKACVACPPQVSIVKKEGMSEVGDAIYDQ